VLPVISATLVLAGILCGWTMYKFEERPLLARVKVMVQPPKEPKVDSELEKTETFLAVMFDDTQDDIRLKNYKPKKVRNRAPLAITAKPSNTVKHMASIQGYMQEHGHTGTNTKRTHRN
jgi:hypothetical protein